MHDTTLGRIGGEFTCATREAAFQADRLPETMRHACLILAISIVLNTLALASDWRFYGQPHFYIAVPARLLVVAASLVCLFVAPRARSFRDLQRVLIGWEVVTTAAVAVLVTSHSDIALLIVVVLPSILILVVPTAFCWTVTFGVGSSVVLLAAYLLPFPLPATTIGLVLASTIQIIALLLMVVRSNRMRRAEWSTVEAHRRTNAELEESKRLFETMFKAVPIPIVVSTAATGRITGMNDAALRFFGFVSGDAPDVFTRDLTPGHARRLVQGEIDKAGTVRDLEIPVLSIDGRRSDVLISADLVELGGETCVVSSLVDITARKLAEEAVRKAATHDVLTGLPNRALFQSTLDAAIATAEHDGSSVGLILIDLDAFKEVNDTLGHKAGDILLKEIAVRLSRVVGKGELVARLGGDEFVVIALCEADPASPSRRIHDLAEHILDVLNPGMAVGGRIVAPRASLGLALFPDHAANAEELFTDADLALYAAKAAGRNRATLFAPALRAAIEERVAIVREMRAALHEGGLIPYYQPKVSLQTGRIVGFEALARWQHPSRGLLTPAVFATVFDDPDIGIAVGYCLLRQICTDIAGWIALGLDPGRVFFNLSSVQFTQNDFAQSLIAEIDRAGLTPDRIGVEVTETVLLGGHGDRVAPVLAKLHAAGLRVALDDFGTGYASLTHLKQYPVDEIKIDRSFVNDLERDANDEAIVTAVLHLGRSLGLCVTAEGVETEAQARFLTENGCTFAQGYLYSRPMAPSRVPWFLTTRRDLDAAEQAATELMKA